MTNELIAIAIILGVSSAVAFHAKASDEEIHNPQTSLEEVKVNDGGMNTKALRVSFNQIFEKTSFEKKPATPTAIVADTSAEAVIAKITTYGVDCNGCYNVNGFGGTAGGVKVSTNPSVLQSNGTWLSGITYDGYYIVAANSSIPLGSIIEISNHGYNGYGLAQGQTFYAMVLDRGAMTLNHLDLFVGSEASNAITINGAYTPTMKVIRYGY